MQWVCHKPSAIPRKLPLLRKQGKGADTVKGGSEVTADEPGGVPAAAWVPLRPKQKRDKPVPFLAPLTSTAPSF